MLEEAGCLGKGGTHGGYKASHQASKNSTEMHLVQERVCVDDGGWLLQRRRVRAPDSVGWPFYCLD